MGDSGAPQPAPEANRRAAEKAAAEAKKHQTEAEATMGAKEDDKKDEKAKSTPETEATEKEEKAQSARGQKRERESGHSGAPQPADPGKEEKRYAPQPNSPAIGIQRSNGLPFGSFATKTREHAELQRCGRLLALDLGRDDPFPKPKGGASQPATVSSFDDKFKGLKPHPDAYPPPHGETGQLQALVYVHPPPKLQDCMSPENRFLVWTFVAPTFWGYLASRRALRQCRSSLLRMGFRGFLANREFLPSCPSYYNALRGYNDPTIYRPDLRQAQALWYRRDVDPTSDSSEPELSSDSSEPSDA